MGAIALLVDHDQEHRANGALLPWYNQLNILLFYIVFRLKLYNQEK